jgi:hypothetical protein
MDYAKIYYKIIYNRKETHIPGYTEVHHIVPRSLGGSDSIDNTVKLSAREHFVCHWLLVKMHKHKQQEYYKMLKAFSMMSRVNGDGQLRYIPSSRIFARYKEDYAKACSFNQKGSKNSQYGTVWCVMEDAPDISNRKKYKNIPDGWITTKEWKDRRKNKRSSAYGRHWYNDGSKNYYLKEFDPLIEQLTKGRLMVVN